MKILRRHPQIVHEDFGGGVIYHGANWPDREALGGAHVHQKNGQPAGAGRRLLARRGAREQQHQVGMLGARGPDLLAVDDIGVAVADRGGAQVERVGARGRLGHSERLQAQLAFGDRRQPALLLCGAAVTKQRPHGVHLRMAGGAVAARRMDLLHDRGSGRERQPAAAVLFRDQRGEEARVCQHFDEFRRIAALPIERAPIFAGKGHAQAAHRFADRRIVVVMDVGVSHATDYSAISARPLLIATTSRSTTRARKLTTVPSRHISVRMVSPGNTGAEKRPAMAVSRAGS